MKRFLQLFVAALVISVAFGSSATAKPRAKHVFIISFDGGKPSVMRKSPMPTFLGMAAQGATSWNAQTVMPSITLVGHTSMLTGVGPKKHKILWNSWIPKLGVVKVPTVFQLARKKGYVTSLFAGKSKFRHLNVPGTINEFQIPGYSARAVAKAAATHIIQKKPNLCFIHFADGDGAGHDSGWGSPEQVRAFANTDAALKVVRDAVQRAGIAGQSTFIMSADHGGHDRTHGSAIPEDMTIPWIAWGAGVKSRFLIPNAINTCDTAATALWLLDIPVPSNWDGKPVKAAFK